jgi:hypothetical protein
VGEKLRINDHPDTGLPFKNFEFEFDFRTAQSNCALFSIDSPIGRGGHDRHVTIQNKKLMIRVWPGKTFCPSNNNYCDDEWHTFRLLCVKGQPIKTFVDRIA